MTTCHLCGEEIPQPHLHAIQVVRGGKRCKEICRACVAVIGKYNAENIHQREFTDRFWRGDFSELDLRSEQPDRFAPKQHAGDE